MPHRPPPWEHVAEGAALQPHQGGTLKVYAERAKDTVRCFSGGLGFLRACGGVNCVSTASFILRGRFTRFSAAAVAFAEVIDMCGLSGIVSADPRLVEPAVRAMTRAMIHRGPDDDGYEQVPLGGGELGGGELPAGKQGAVAGLGFRRLSILDLSQAGHQPMFNRSTGDCLIFNGEIYNFRELRNQLESQGVSFRGSSDTEVLLQALSTWGEAAVAKLNGMFAFAFYEARSRRILLARDPLGIKPLYVAAFPERIIFASEIRTILASGLVPRDLDVAGIAGMLAYGSVPSPHTAFASIRSFPPGHLQWIGAPAGTPLPAPKAYWNFPSQPNSDGWQNASLTVQQLLRDAVGRQLTADVPVGVFLSAGIDSTLIASLAREFSPQVTAFTVGFGSSLGEDEIGIASGTAKRLGIRHVAVELAVDNMPTMWHDWMSGMDSPSIDGFNTYAVSRSLADDGVVVGLSGLGADELFGGYPTFSRTLAWSARLGALAFVPRWLQAGAVDGLRWIGMPAGAVEKLRDLVAGDRSVAGIVRSLRRALPNRRLEAMGLFPTRLGLSADYLDPARTEVTLDGDPFNTVSRIESSQYMRDTLLRDTDANSMRHSLEIRVPFLDQKLVDYVSALPGSVKYDPRQPGKMLLRAACQALLSDEISKRPKTGFTLPIGAWMQGVMREPCEEAIEYLAAQPIIDGAEVRRTWQTFLSDNRSIHWSRPLSLVVLGRYLQQTAGPELLQG